MSVQFALLAVARTTAASVPDEIDAATDRATAAGHKILTDEIIADSEATIRERLTELIANPEIDVVLVLAGAEWFVPVAAAGDVVPAIFGQTLAGPMDGHEPIMPATLRHYDLHVWLWKHNPRGMFTSTNAALKCNPGAPYTVVRGEHHKH